MKSLVVCDSIEKIQNFRKSLDGKQIGFVPTMGALHLGHATLLKQARQENDFVVLSIFVNPTQFNDPQDFVKYPQSLESDFQLAQQENVDCIFLPTEKQIYPEGKRFRVSENDFSKTLCGEFRANHFDGVLTIVMKLLQLIKPTRAYFGEKDFQQLTLVQDMVSAFFMDVQIVPIPTVRESCGLAMSSRNLRLDSQQKKQAAKLFQIASAAKSPYEAKEQLKDEGFAVEYVVDLKQRRFVAAKLGDVRLIDNVEI